MNLGKKKKLAVRTLGVGESRIVFVKSRLNEIKEAITKQDIRDLSNSGAIFIKDVKGRKKNERKKIRRKDGKVRKKINVSKREYVHLTRKLRKYLSELKNQGKITEEESKDFRKKIKNRYFKSKANLKEHIGGIKL